MFQKLKSIEKWKYLACLPLLIGLIRVIHFILTGYFLPDEATYLSCVIHYFNDGNLFFYGPRQLFQFLILGISILFNLSTPEKFVPFFVLLTSVLSCLSIYLSVKISEKLVPNFTEKWLVPLLFILSPIYCVIGVLILTECISIFFALLTIYIFIHPKNWSRSILMGVFCGLCYHYREPLFIIPAYIILWFIYHKEIKNTIVFLLGFIPFFGGAIVRLSFKILFNIILPVDLVEPKLPLFILNLIGGDIGDIERLGGLAWNLTHSPPPIFIRTSILDFGVMLIFGLGIFSTILISYGIYKRKTNHLIVLGLMLMFISSMYLNRYLVYTTLFYTKISTVIRYGVMGVFCIPFIPILISDWDKVKIKRYATFSIIGIVLMAIPFTTFVQSNLSDQPINRLDIFNYRSPWLITKNILKQTNETNIMVICEPMTRIRFYYLEEINYSSVKKWHRLCVNYAKENKIYIKDIGISNEKFIEIFKELLEQYSHVYLYVEKYSLYDSVLESQVPWYWEFISNPINHEVLYENAEMFLLKVNK